MTDLDIPVSPNTKDRKDGPLPMNVDKTCFAIVKELMVYVSITCSTVILFQGSPTKEHPSPTKEKKKKKKFRMPSFSKTKKAKDSKESSI